MKTAEPVAPVEGGLVTWPVSGMWVSTRARNSNGSTVPVPTVEPSDLSEGLVLAKQRHARKEALAYHPLVNAATLVVDREGVERLLQATGHPNQLTEIPSWSADGG
jgi:hypothetical protein